MKFIYISDGILENGTFGSWEDFRSTDIYKYSSVTIVHDNNLNTISYDDDGWFTIYTSELLTLNHVKELLAKINYCSPLDILIKDYEN